LDIFYGAEKYFMGAEIVINFFVCLVWWSNKWSVVGRDWLFDLVWVRIPQKYNPCGLGCFLFWQIQRYQKACVKSWRFGSFRAPHQNFSPQFLVTWSGLSSFCLSCDRIFHTKWKSCQTPPILILFSNFWCRPHFIVITHDITSSFH
jgi:hypothetical protein